MASARVTLASVYVCSLDCIQMISGNTCQPCIYAIGYCYGSPYSQKFVKAGTHTTKLVK